jgi:uncharacterized protein (DUF1501 family)
VAGGKVYGRWPGLAREALYENRDLAITTDFRSAIATVLEGHMKIGADAVARVLPGAPAAQGLNGMIRA